jgi:tetratricopeptide (TPR) repeat protein
MRLRRLIPRLLAFELAAMAVLFPILSNAQEQHLQDSARMLQQGKFADAELAARSALLDPPSRPLAYALLGAIRLQQTRYADSAGFLEKAVRLNPLLLGAQLNLGNVYVLQGKTGFATARFREVLRMDPSNFDARFALARLESEAGDYKASTETAKPITEKLHHSEDGLLLLASNYLAQDDQGMASSLVPGWFALDHPDTTASLSFAQTFASRHMFKQAISILEHNRNQDGDSFELDSNLAAYNFGLNQFLEATNNYQLALNAHPNCSHCLYQLARISEQQLKPDEALGYLIAARLIAPKDPDIVFEFGRICLRKDLYKDAIESLSAAVQLRPDNDSFQYVLASAYTSDKEYKLAIPILKHLLETKPNDSLLNYSLGAIEYLDSDLADAQEHLQRSIKSNPDQVAAYYYLGLTENHEGKTEQAAQILQSLTARYPDHAPTFLALGKILSGQRRYSEARSALERATQLDSSSVEGHYQLGLVLARVGQSEASKREFALVKTLNEQADQQTEMQIFSPQD